MYVCMHVCMYTMYVCMYVCKMVATEGGGEFEGKLITNIIMYVIIQMLLKVEKLLSNLFRFRSVVKMTTWHQRYSIQRGPYRTSRAIPINSSVWEQFQFDIRDFRLSYKTLSVYTLKSISIRLVSISVDSVELSNGTFESRHLGGQIELLPAKKSHHLQKLSIPGIMALFSHHNVPAHLFQPLSSEMQCPFSFGPPKLTGLNS